MEELQCCAATISVSRHEDLAMESLRYIDLIRILSGSDYRDVISEAQLHGLPRMDTLERAKKVESLMNWRIIDPNSLTLSQGFEAVLNQVAPGRAFSLLSEDDIVRATRLHADANWPQGEAR
jgi:hypothetical protein